MMSEKFDDTTVRRCMGAAGAMPVPVPGAVLGTQTSPVATVRADPRPSLAAGCYQAREGLARRDAAMAAMGLRQIETLVKGDWPRASEQGRWRIEVALAALTGVRRQAEHGVLAALASFDSAVVQLHGALAWHEWERAHQALHEGRPRRLAEALIAATRHVRSAVAWADARLDDESAAAVAGAWTTAQVLRRGEEGSFHEIDARLVGLARAIRSVTARSVPHAR